ncbi:MAG: RsmB/NOP family class I SAM-dependent RNA methyltransferase [Promethearchaeota archaeon]
MKVLETIQNLIKFIDKFNRSKKFSLPRDITIEPQIIYYFSEVVRNWNKLNYIIKKTLRSINFIDGFNELEQALLFYIAYRIRFENIPLDYLHNNLKNYGINDRNFEKFKSFIEKTKSFSWEIALKGKSNVEKLSITESIPSFFIEKLQEVMDISSIRENLRFMNNFKKKDEFSIYLTHDVDFELNTFFYKNFKPASPQTDQIFKKDSDISHIYHIPLTYKVNFVDSKLVKSGDLIVLDKASASVVDLLYPEPKDFILDMCAAPGVKTSLISHYTKSNSNIIANDFSSERTNTLKKLTGRIVNNKIHILNSDSISIPLRSLVKFDKILLDAPCTGSGALLSNPELKWRQNEKFLHQNMILQEKLLRSAIDLLKPSGILVYSTCSLYPEEGEYQVNKFLEELEPMNLPKWMGRSYQIEGSSVCGTARLYPAQHHTEGFFIAKFKKN